MAVSEARSNDLLVASRILASHGLASGNAGYLVERVGDDSFLVNRFGPLLSRLKLTDIITCDANAVIVEGTGVIHDSVALFARLLVRTNHTSLVHTHGKFSTFLASSDARVRIVDQDSCAIAREISRCDEYLWLEDSPRALNLLETCASKGPCILLPAHGSVVMGKSMSSATYRSIILEHVAELSILANCHNALGGEVSELSSEQITLVRQKFETMPEKNAFWRAWSGEFD